MATFPKPARMRMEWAGGNHKFIGNDPVSSSVSYSNLDLYSDGLLSSIPPGGMAGTQGLGDWISEI